MAHFAAALLAALRASALVPLQAQPATPLPQKIARASGGEIELQINEPDRLVPAARTMFAVADGLFDAGWGGAGWFAASTSR